MKNNKKDKTQFSKILVVITGVIFVLGLISCLIIDKSSIYDTSMFVTIIATTGGVFGSAIIWYEKKAQAENISKIKLMHVKEITKLEYDIYEKKLRLHKELDKPCDPEDMSSFHIDEMKEDAVLQDSTYLDNKLDDASSDPEIQSY